MYRPFVCVFMCGWVSVCVCLGVISLVRVCLCVYVSLCVFNCVCLMIFLTCRFISKLLKKQYCIYFKLSSVSLICILKVNMYNQKIGKSTMTSIFFTNFCLYFYSFYHNLLCQIFIR